ncbi:MULTISPECIES: helix-turn-helix domain-containing protein, partial [Collinsella]|uniref:helix-turn-helix domain-containing protein n=1 Tax=Collinsella TaxID=102106 RepID=UPI0018F487E6
MWESDTLRAGPAGPGRSEDGMSGKRKKGAGKAAPRAYGRLTRHERNTVQRMLERGASCRQIARELGRSPSTVSAEVASHRFVTAPRERRGERVDASADLSAACMPAPGRVAAMLQRVRAVPRGRLQAPPARLLRGPRRAAVRGLGPRLVEARDRRRRARRGRGARPHPRRPGPWAVARAAVRPQRRARG